DTKYEFGRAPDGSILLIDEVHTPDSSRYWKADTYAARVAEGLEPESFDKEFVRLAYSAVGYRGDGPVPEVRPTLWDETSALYRQAFERLTGTAFEPGEYPVGPRLERNLRSAGLLR
ncbi:MAG: phosphoribosylaminoimidazolesuccinocarboxamide synthase, partial [Spirochaetes bacterium]|nr:phosphoribosylaminoimidazolesuccinocarboxamide synthase [Spirochaetota bacterium]